MPRTRRFESGADGLRLVAAGAALSIACLARPATADWPQDPSVNLPVCAAPGNQNGAVPVSSGSGATIVAWYDFRSGSDFDLDATRILAGGVLDPAWPAGGSLHTA